MGALAEVDHVHNAFALDILGPLNIEEYLHLKDHPDRVFAVYTWFTQIMLMMIHTKAFQVHPAMKGIILAWMNIGLEQAADARKVADVPFPFPFAQVLEVLLFIFCFFCVPLTISIYTNGWFFPGHTGPG